MVKKINRFTIHIITTKETKICLSKYQFLQIQSTPNNSNLQGKSKKVRVIGSSSYQELEEKSQE